MKLPVLQRQQLVFLGLILLTILAANWTYGRLRGGYILFHEAERLLKTGELKRANTVLGQALNTGIDSPLVLKKAAEAFLQRREFEPAAALYHKLHMQKPGDAEVAVKLAETLNLGGHGAESAAILQKWLQDNPRSLAVWLWLGFIQQSRGSWDEAMKAYERALALEPDSREALVGLGNAQAYGGNYSRAEASYRRALEKYPADRDARIRLARVLSWQGKNEPAIRQYQLALEEKQ